MPKIGGPPSVEGIDGGPSARGTISPVRDHDVGRGADRDGSANWCRRGCERKDGARHERADGANRENGGSEDVSPNAHDCLHAFTEVNCLDPGSGGPARTSLFVFFHSPVFGDYIS